MLGLGGYVMTGDNFIANDAAEATDEQCGEDEESETHFLFSFRKEHAALIEPS